MRALFIAICLGICVVFYRSDIQLLAWLPAGWNVLIVLGLAFSFGLLLLLLRPRKQSLHRAVQMTGWLVVIWSFLALLERPFEPVTSQVLAANQTKQLGTSRRVQVAAHIVPAKEGLFEVTARSGDTQFPAMLDTGASTVLLTFETAKELGLEPDTLVFETLVDTAAGQAKIAEVILPSLTVGKIQIKEIAAAVSPEGVEHANLLGASFLSKLSSVEFQADRAVMTLRKQP